eukprot:GHVP01033396.1.p2 GENE.GHVP01033396.1~~GHVP01033396.1.p2  ORF type:complete len:146 (+),score=25.63 GHVP01033396.1:1078-1515(+)
MACTSCRACVERFPDLRFYKNRNRILFTIECEGQLHPRVLLKKAINILKTKGSNLITLAEEVHVPPEQQSGVAFTLKDEDHTIGNVLNFYLNLNPSVEFGAYNQSHPSQQEIIVRIQSEDPITALVTAANDIKYTCDKLMEAVQQ